MEPKNEHTLRHIFTAFILSLVLYVGFYKWDAHTRHRKGAWRVEFSATNGEPFIVIEDLAMGISNVVIVATGEVSTNAASSSVTFDTPFKPVPVGRVRFEDLTYLPGTVVLDFYGHEVQLIPRVLTVNGKEIPWQNNATVRLQPAEKRPQRPELERNSHSRGPFGRSTN